MIGVPVGVKDIFNTKICLLKWKFYMENFTAGNDEVVHNLKEAGAIISGKTVTAEFAHKLNETLNPHDKKLTRTSSSGSWYQLQREFVQLR